MSSINFYNKDCLPEMRKMKDNQYDLAIVDPPYGINVTSMKLGGRKTIKKSNKDWDSSIPKDEYFKELFRVSKNQIIWGGNYFKLPPSQYFAIWDKGETMYGRSFAECEYAWVSFKATRIYKKSPNQLQRIHPTQKHIKLYEWLLFVYADKGNKILDTHGGSMSIALACHNLGFDLDLYEIDKEYFNNGVKRYKDHIKQIRMF